MTNRDFPNIIVIVLDTARADGFDPYGAPAGTTPAVAQLASSGVAVEHAYAPSNWTMPSHASMFTGLLPRTAGLSSPPGQDQTNCGLVLEQHFDRLLPSVLGKAGYDSLGASTNVWISKRTGFDTGFGEFRDLIGKRVARMHEDSLRAQLVWYTQALLARIDDGLTQMDATVTDWLDRPQKRPFFWFMNLIECHSPYMPPKPYNDLGPVARLKSGQDARRYQGMFGVWKACATGIMPPREALERMRHLYGRSITFMDDWIGKLCERLDKKGVLDDTLIVVTSDHGENFGEGSLFGHAVSLDDRLIRIPLVLTGPGARSVPDAPVSLANLPRLLADAVGLGDHPWRSDDVPEEAIVSQYDTGMDPKDPRLQIFREWGATEEGFRRFTEPGTAATDGRYKLFTLGPNDERLYDLQSDPLEVSPVRPDLGPPDVVERLRRALSKSARTEWVPDVATLQKREKPSDDDLTELENRMKLLGYM